VEETTVGINNGIRLRRFGEMTDSTTTNVVELATRSSDGLEVALSWSRRSGRVWVDVLHVATGESMTIDADPARALDVYYHPFAYSLADAA
jgi:hypothetical protein